MSNESKMAIFHELQMIDIKNYLSNAYKMASLNNDLDIMSRIRMASEILNVQITVA